MHEQRFARGVVMRERPRQQPLEQRVAIGRLEHVFERVADLVLRFVAKATASRCRS